MKRENKLMAIILLALTLAACRADYKTYAQYKNDLKAQSKPATRSEYIKDYMTCEKHNTRMHRAVLAVKYGVLCTHPQPDNTTPNAKYTICGGAELKPARFVVRPVCKKCTARFKTPK